MYGRANLDLLRARLIGAPEPSWKFAPRLRQALFFHAEIIIPGVWGQSPHACGLIPQSPTKVSMVASLGKTPR
jgi:hypothetical protein